MSMRWRITGLPLSEHNTADSVGEPYDHFEDKTGGIIVLCKEPYFSEDDEPQSSHHHPQVERERG